ncbi:MAG: VanZ family protein [Flavobacteriaceae bacterium]
MSLVKIKAPVKVSISYLDKLVHIGIYALYTLVWFMCFVTYDVKHRVGKALVKASVLALFTGVLIEILQELNPNARSGDVKDVLANAVGILIAVLFVQKIKKYRALNSVK